jgi:hypothetical protein
VSPEARSTASIETASDPASANSFLAYSDVARACAAWLLWAIAVALVLAVISATDADDTE